MKTQLNLNWDYMKKNDFLEEFTNYNEQKENNGILFWGSLSTRFPILSRMACDYLGIKPSSVSSERAFSRTDFTITNNRVAISEKTVSSMILMHSWLIESQNKFSPLEDLP
ncbi:13025_t:CDS:1 [Cetraspora pellucida]|uniref:13025_t:CDS:1 n=1 Tax=Cetraspora pellucida TaxID=1433469 RepID=A0A9N9J622_9GLOM|nr:13025_t:CDS:1 [Cetraspora pellucida]